MTRGGRYAAWFLLLYGAALVINLPARLLVRFLPPPVQVTAVSGTVWSGHIGQLRWQTLSLNNVSWRWAWPGIRITAQGDAGRGGVTLGWMGAWRLSDGRWQTPLQAVMDLTGLPLPVGGGGDLVLTLDRMRVDAGGCRDLAATLTWQGAALIAGEQRVALGEPRAQLGCQPRQLTFELRQMRNAPLLAGQGSFDAAGYRFSGRIGLPDALPPLWRQMAENATRPGDNGQRITEISGTWTLPRR